jgi:DivIVA domain-containing protein
MSTTDVDLLGPPLADDLYNPEFAVVLRGYDPEEVRAYVQNVATHIDALQRQLRDARDQIEAGRRQYMAAKEAAYKQLATHMADLLHTADLEAERLRREGSDEADRVRSEAERIAAQTRRDADSQADLARREGEEMLWRARAETERILGGLALKREEMLKELEATRGRLRGVMASIESTILATQEDARRGQEAAMQLVDRAHTEVGAMEPPPHTAEPGPEPSPLVPEFPHQERAELAQETISDIAYDEEGAPAEAPAWETLDAPSADERITSVEDGFDLVLPDIRIDEDGEVGEVGKTD